MNRHIFNLARTTACRVTPTVWTRGVTEKAWAVVKVGRNILVDGVPYSVTKALQGGRGRGASFVKAKLKNLYTGKGIDKTFISEDPVEVPELDRYEVEYSWDDETDFVFMDSSSFEEFRVPKKDLVKAKFLLPGQKIVIFKYKEAFVEIVFPHSQEYTLKSIDTSERV